MAAKKKAAVANGAGNADYLGAVAVVLVLTLPIWWPISKAVDLIRSAWRRRG